MTAEYDLSYVIAAHVDTHMVFPILDFLIQETKLYNPRSLSQAKYELACRTKMVDFAATEYAALHEGKEPADKEERKASVFRELEELQTLCTPLLEIIAQEDYVADLRGRGCFTLEYLREREHKNITDAMVDGLYRFAKLNFDCGRYRDAADYLAVFRLLSLDEERKFWALWGKCAAEILMVNCEIALADLTALNEAINQRIHTDHLSQLQQRSWLIHWSLFIFFNLQDGRNRMIDFLLQEKLLNAIQLNCPHILRYLTTAIIITKRRKTVMKDIVRVILQERGVYSDPITEFLITLYVDFDFDTAHQKLEQCEKLLKNDFFLGFCATEFMENARLLLFETYCRIHQRIDITTLASRLSIPPADAESRIVELIRTARVDAKIDSKSNQIVVSSDAPSLYQQVIDKTKGLTYRTSQLAGAIDKRMAQIQASLAAQD